MLASGRVFFVGVSMLGGKLLTLPCCPFVEFCLEQLRLDQTFTNDERSSFEHQGIFEGVKSRKPL